MLLYCFRITFFKTQIGWSSRCSLKAFTHQFYFFPFLFNCSGGSSKFSIHRSQILPKSGQTATPCLCIAPRPNPVPRHKEAPFFVSLCLLSSQTMVDSWARGLLFRSEPFSPYSILSEPCSLTTFSRGRADECPQRRSDRPHSGGGSYTWPRGGVRSRRRAWLLRGLRHRGTRDDTVTS